MIKLKPILITSFEKEPINGTIDQKFSKSN